jgi:hypothetical protein
LAQRIHNADASQQVENVKARHTYLHARADATTEWLDLWSERDERGWAHAFGCMKGFDQVWFGLVGNYDMMAMQTWLAMRDFYPEVIGKDPRPLMECSVHTLVTDVIEVADDGMSARGSFITPGVIHSVLTPMQEKFCGILWERYGSDFVYENGGWKYLNEQVNPDILTKMDDMDWAAWDYANRTSDNPEPPHPPTLGDPPPTRFGGWHIPWNSLQEPQDSVPWPEPYKTLDEEHKYNHPWVYNEKFKDLKNHKLPGPGKKK